MAPAAIEQPEPLCPGQQRFPHHEGNREMRWGEEAPLDSKEAAPRPVLSASHGVGFACGQRLLTVRYEGFFSFAVEVTNICAGMYFIHFLDFRKGRLKNSTVFLSCIMLLHNMFFINFLKGFFC